MKSVFQFLQMDHKHMEHQLCHPRRQASFDNTAIEKKIQQIRQRKQQLRVQAQRKKQQIRRRQERLEDFPLQAILQQTLQPLQQSVSLMIKQKMKFTEDKVYIGTKNNVNNEYITKVIDSLQAKPALKYELNLFMQDLVGNVQSDIFSGEYQIFNRKDTIIPKHQQLNIQNPTEQNTSKLIQIKKVELSQKIEDLKDELIKTQLEHQKLSPPQLNRKSFSIRSASLNGSSIEHSLNIDDFSIKSTRTKQAQQFIKKLQKQQQQKRKQRQKRQQQLRKLQIKSQQQKKQFQQQLKKQKHQSLKRKYQSQRKQKLAQFQKAQKTKQQYQKFLSQYRKRLPLFKQKQKKFIQKSQKENKQKMVSILTQIKQAKRSIDINQIKEHQKKYQVMRKEFQQEKLANLQHRQKQILLRHKQDRLYFRGRYHSMLKQQQQKQPQDPAIKRDQLLKKRKQFAQKVKKDYVPKMDQKKEKQLQQLIQKINRNKPNIQSKDFNQVGNKYLAQLHKFIKDCKQKGKIKVQIPQQIKPRYKDYLQQIKRSRNYSTISYNKSNLQDLQLQAFRAQQNFKRKQKILSIDENVDITKQLKQIDQLDMELLKSAQIKAKLLEKYDPKQNQSDQED